MKKLIYILILIFVTSTVAISQSQEKKVLKKETKIEKKESSCSTEKSEKGSVQKENCDISDKKTNYEKKTEEACCSADKKSSKNTETKIDDNSSETLKPFNLVCPVTGEEIDPEQAKTVTYNGKVYGFCCPRCADKFNKDPESYIKNLSEDGKTFLKN